MQEEGNVEGRKKKRRKKKEETDSSGYDGQ